MPRTGRHLSEKTSVRLLVHFFVFNWMYYTYATDICQPENYIKSILVSNKQSKQKDKACHHQI